MLPSILALAASVVGTALLVPQARRWARARGLLDDSLPLRRTTGKPVPRVGGVAVVGGVALGLVVAAAAGAAVGPLLPLMAGGVAMAALGVYDDLRGAGAERKFLIQFLIASALYAGGFRVEVVALPGVGTLDLEPLGLPVTLLWIVGACNAFNLIDGLDGLAAGVAVSAAAALGFGSMLRGDPAAAVVMACAAGAAIGFLPYNSRPATVLLGDGGSLFLGLVLAAGTLRPGGAGALAGDLTMPVIALALPVVDTGWAIVRRLRQHKRLFMADRDHIHHRLARAFGEPAAVRLIHAACIVAGGAVVAMAWFEGGGSSG